MSAPIVAFPIDVKRVPELPVFNISLTPLDDADELVIWRDADDTTYSITIGSLKSGLGDVQPFAVNGNDTDTIIVTDLIDKTLLSLSTDGVQRNFLGTATPQDCVFTSGTGELVFLSEVSSGSIIQGTYK